MLSLSPKSCASPHFGALFALLLLGCVGGQTGTPTQDRDDDDHEAGSDAGPHDPDARRSLGVRGELLWQAYEGDYALHGIWRRDQRVPELAQVTLSLRRALVANEADSVLSVPVQVALTTADGLLDLALPALLVGSLEQAKISFGCSQPGASCSTVSGRTLSETDLQQLQGLRGSVQLMKAYAEVEVSVAGADPRVLKAQGTRGDGGVP